jgi:hypothetical protein
MSKKKNDTINQLDILCSIWILACNDDNPQITYQGLTHRLGLADDFDVRPLVQSRGELFRKQTSLRQLNSWKVEMLQNKHFPSWIREIDDKNLRTEKINSLTQADVFRSQFRAEASSPRSDIVIINWGLQHIDRLRKAELETKQERTRFFTSVIIPISSTVVTILALLSSFYVQYTNNQNQTFLKHYEVELKPKQEGYTNYMKAVSQSYFAAQANTIEQMTQSLDRAENSFYIIEPFLSAYDRNRIWNQYQQFTGLCYSVAQSDSLRKAPSKSFNSFFWYKTYFRENLYEALFKADKQKDNAKE